MPHGHRLPRGGLGHRRGSTVATAEEAKYYLAPARWKQGTKALDVGSSPWQMSMPYTKVKSR
eukprot:scaffold23104_cov27-Tisochrysis_lutea.AAC.3